MHAYQPDGFLDWSFTEKARSMQKNQVKALKEKLLRHPNDLNTRRLLFERAKENHLKSILPHLIWFIDNHPKDSVLQLISWTNADDIYREARKHWVAKVRSNPDDVTILCHAAQFTETIEPLVAAKFLQKASDIDTFDDELPRRLSNAFMLKARACPSRAKYYLRKSVEQMKIAIDRYAVPSDEGSYLLPYFSMELSQLAKMALDLDLLDEAKDLGQLLLQHKEINAIRLRIKSEAISPSYDMSKHSGHAVLSVVSLRSKNLDEAQIHLKCMKSLVNQQVPDDRIIEALLKIGEFDCALEYLGPIYQYWKKRVHGTDESNEVATNIEYEKSMEQYVRKLMNRVRKESV
jgi:hypothetical protein